MQLSGFSPEGPHCLLAVSGSVDQKRSQLGGMSRSLVSEHVLLQEAPAVCLQKSQETPEHSNTTGLLA